MTENEFMLEDRIAKIKAINEQYNLKENAYISFSGGKDSCILSELIDLALPNNNIPRVYFNTGLEYADIFGFVRDLCTKDKRIQIVNSGVNIRKMLRENGYPFKSKQHAHNWEIYSNNREESQPYIDYLKANPKMQFDYDYIHSLPSGIKTTIKYVFGIRERERVVSTSILIAPNKLKYQFTKDFNKFKLSDKCCYRLKKDTAHRYEEENKRFIAITGIRGDEGGMRAINGCTIFDGDNLKKFHPIKVVSSEWEEWFIKKYNIKLCKLYYPPYNFVRTGCKGCPFSLTLQKDLDTMALYLPNERKQCEILWKPVYDEYRRLNYRLTNQMNIFDFLEEE